MNKNKISVWELPQDAIARLGQGYTSDLAVSADGTSLAVGTDVGVWWYDLTTRQPVSLFETERGMVGYIALCSGEPWVAVKNTDKNGDEVIKIWDTHKQQCIAVMEYPARLKENPPRNYLCSLCFSPSGQWLAVSRDGSVVVDIYETITGKLRTSLDLPSEEIELDHIDDWPDNGFFWDFSGALAFSLHDCLLASSHWSDFISVWDIMTRERISRLTGLPEGVHSLSFSPCGQFLSAGGVKGTVQVWDTSTWELQQTYPSQGHYQMNVSYTPGGTLRAAGLSHDQCTVTVWDVARQEVLYTFHEKNYYDAEMYPIHFSNGTHLALKSDFEIHVKTVGVTAPPAILPWELGDLHSLVFSPDGQTLCAGYRQFGGVMLWDVATHRPQRVVTEPRCHIVSVYSDTATGKFYAAGFLPGESLGWGNTLNLWEIGQSAPIAELTIPGEPPDRRDGMAYAPATQLLACGHGTEKDDESWDENDPENGAVYVWDVARGQMRHIFRGKHTDRIIILKFSPDGTRLLSMDFNDYNTVRLWDMMSGEEIGEFPENFVMQGGSNKDPHIKSLKEDFGTLTPFSPQVFSTCGNLIAGHFSRQRILVWDIERCEARLIIQIPPRMPDGRPAFVDPIALSPCGQYLAYGEIWWSSGGVEKVPFQCGVEKVPVRLWDIRTGENIATFLGHPTDIQCLAFSPDSTLLASGSFDHTILLWDLKPYL